MELATLRKMVVATIALLLIYQVGTWIAAFFGGFWGGLAALVVAVVSYVCVRLAGGNVAWFLVPSLLFVVVPLAARIWNALADKQSSWMDHVISITPLLVGFVIPVVLLLLVYAELRRRTLSR